MIDIQKLKFQISEFTAKYRIKFVVLFGSRAKENARNDSDFDVAVAFNSGRSIFDNTNLYSEILENFSKIFNVKEDRVDLTDLNRANILLRYDITSGGELLYGDEDDYAQFKAFAFREYIDAKPLFDLENYLINKRQRLIGEVLLK